ncbi:MAG: hypothetical protein KAR42_08205 [candidate division Zixibacteria bacterium]|nr:hypothetical protein [candidate division Zixibacteria bacterium]
MPTDYSNCDLIRSGFPTRFALGNDARDCVYYIDVFRICSILVVKLLLEQMWTFIVH